MRINRFAIKLLFLCGILSSCVKQKQSPNLRNTDISAVVTKMTDIMIHDVTNPPLAARFFSYACLAGYEVTAQNDSSITSMYGILNGYPAIQKPDSVAGYSYPLAAVLAMLETASGYE